MEFWGLTDRGQIRTENQDSYAVKRLGSAEEPIVAAVVCDGMGGAKAGNVASQMGVELFLSNVAEKLTAYDQAELLIRRAVREANRAIYDKAASGPDFTGMGTTFVAVVATGKEALVANIGDSRCYLVRSKCISQITKDHSLVEDMVDRGEIDRAQAWLHPRRNYITRALGTDENTECDLFRVPLEEGDVLLLCSDGLSGVLNQQELLFEVVYGGELESAVRRMVDIALQRGAPDNVTAVLLANGTVEADDEQSS